MKYNILALSTFSVDSTFSGSKYALKNLFRRMTEQFNINYVSLVPSNKKSKIVRISKGFKNFQIPISVEQEHIRIKKEKLHNVDNLVDFIQIDYWHKNPEFVNSVKKLIDDSDIIILEHPYFANLIDSLKPTIPIIYHAIDAEFLQKKSTYDEKLLDEIKKLEKKACEMSIQIWNSSEREQKLLISEYKIPETKFKTVPHGVDFSNTEFTDREDSKLYKSSFQPIKNKTIFVFPASAHPPNLEALNFIISELAEINSNYLFFVIGNIKNYFLQKNPNTKIPKNVILFGTVSDQEKFGIYKLSDYGLNPMFSGAGTNLKIIEYMTVGLPIITTDFGARGTKLSKNTMICTKESIVKKIKEITNLNYHNSSSIKENYELAKNYYDYDIISKNCENFLMEIINERTKKFEEHFKNLGFSNMICDLNLMNINNNDTNIINSISKEIEPLIIKKEYPQTPIKSSIEKPIFIIGVPRSGTTLLYNIFCHHPDVSWFSNEDLKYLISKKEQQKLRDKFLNLKATNEKIPLGETHLFVFGQGGTPPIKGTKKIPIEADRFWTKYFGVGYIKKIPELSKNDMIFVLSQLLRRDNKQRFLNKAPQNCKRIFAIKNIFPDAKFVYIIRDPRAVISSMIERHKNEGKFDLGIPVKNKLKLYFLPFVLKWAWRYKEIIEYIHKFQTLEGGKNFITVRYEELVTNPNDEIKKLIKFCELKEIDPVSKIVPRINKQTPKWEKNLTKEDQKRIFKMLNPSFKKIGIEYKVDF